MTFLEVVSCVSMLLSAGLIGFLGGYYEKLFRQDRDISARDVIEGETLVLADGSTVKGTCERRMK